MRIPPAALFSALCVFACVPAGAEPPAAEFPAELSAAGAAYRTQIPPPVNPAARAAAPENDAAELAPEELRIVENADKALALAGRGDRFDLMPETPLSGEYAVLAAGADHKGKLDLLLRAMAGACLAHPGFKRDPRTHTRAMLRGIMSYLSGAGGAVGFQERQDLALHFTYAAYLDLAYGYNVARAAAARKESHDSQQEGNSCDYDDYAASMLGVNWAEKRTADLEAWLGKWGTGERKLDDIPPLQFGRERPGDLPRPGKLREVDSFAAKIMR
ncbi:MAG: hypothetical protein HY550_09815 [Elusimicrobia bacterium]|nr:hypothetical protein [Elusimicrobiota bacterium]